MVVRTGLGTTVGNLLRQVMCPVHTAEPRKDTFVIVSRFQHSLPISAAGNLSVSLLSCMTPAALLSAKLCELCHHLLKVCTVAWNLMATVYCVEPLACVIASACGYAASSAHCNCIFEASAGQYTQAKTGLPHVGFCMFVGGERPREAWCCNCGTWLLCTGQAVDSTYTCCLSTAAVCEHYTCGSSTAAHVGVVIPCQVVNATASQDNLVVSYQSMIQLG